MAVAGGGGQKVGGEAGGLDSRGCRAGGDGREPDGAGAVGERRARWLTREEMAGYRKARGSFCGWWGRRGHGREPDGVGEVGARRARWLEREGWQGAGGPDGSCWGSGVVGGWQGVGVQDGGSQ